MELVFAKFLFGSFAAVKRKVGSEADRWTRQYREHKTFPVPAEALVAPGSLVMTSDISDFQRESDRWRVYFTRALGSAIHKALKWRDHERVAADFEDATTRFSWGALDAAVGHLFPNSLPVVSRRLKAVLGFWEPLDTLQYIGRDAQLPLSLAELLRSHYEPLIEAWLGRPASDVRSDLGEVVARMESASAEDVRDKVTEALLDLAQTDTRIKNREALRSRARTAAMLETLEPREYDNLTGLYVPALNQILYGFDEMIPQEN